tara:strand:- start:435 stop:1052 length:618 start_codon:yes stop_codon:yes gene_type:complete
MLIKEACVETIEEAIKAEAGGADQIELCSRLDLDGLTPDFDIIRKVLNSIQIPVKVMIRCRDGNFSYNELEISRMVFEIQKCKTLGVNEVTLGCITKKNEIDVLRTKLLAHKAYPMEVTFHKAIDKTNDIIGGLDTLSKINQIKSILTSGASDSAKEGALVIRKIIEKFQNRFNIFACGKITKDNFKELHGKIGAEFYHGRKIVG